MIISSGPDSFAARGLSLMRSVGGWVAIHPEQTYVATSIRGLGACKSTYCHAERREPPAKGPGHRIRLAPALAAALAAIGFLSACAGYRPVVDIRDVTDRGQYEHDLADCQNFSAPVSPGVASGRAGFRGAAAGAAIAPAAPGEASTIRAAYTETLTGNLAAGAEARGVEARIVGNCMSGRGYLALN